MFLDPKICKFNFKTNIEFSTEILFFYKVRVKKFKKLVDGKFGD